MKFFTNVAFYIALTIALSLPTFAQQYHLEVFEQQKFTITVSDTLPFLGTIPTLKLIATVPPVLPSQKDITISMWYNKAKIGTVSQELSPLHRNILTADLKDVSEKPTITTIYTGVLKRRHLVPGPGKYTIPEPSISDGLQTLRHTLLCDWDRSEFQAFLDTSGLRMKQNEGALMFGYRAFCFVKDKYTYSHTENSGADFRTATFLTKVNQLDCGEAVLELTAILRANSIPCRIKIGRVIETANASTQYGAHQHVTAEFFVSGIGWVPVEVTGALGMQDTTYTFGYDNRWFLVTHVENDLLLDVNEEKRTMNWMAVMRYFSPARQEGEVLENFSFESEPAVTPSVASTK